MAQSIAVSPATTAADVQNYVENVLLGSCVTASNITYNGAAVAAGTFNGNGTILGLNSGVLLTTGQAIVALGPDNANSIGAGNGLGGDPDLTVLASGFQTYDASILEFDFIPQSDTLRFNYIFGSEEYPEYVSSGYNDVFGFFISGPGIAGPFSGGAMNIALIPGTSTPVAIDNVNNGYSGSEPALNGPCTNCAYYVDNSNGPAVQYDAYTTVLTAVAVVTPCLTYHIKIAVADAGDGALDSGVFLEAGSFSAGGGEGAELNAITSVSGVYEGCDIGSFVFKRLSGASNAAPLTVAYNVSGTATPGADYTALPGTITIPAGQDSVILNIQGVLDFVTEGTETVVLGLVGGGCTCASPPTVSMDILDNDTQLSLSTSGTTTICLGQSANLTANPAGSISPYASGWNNGAPAGNNVTVSPTATTTYTYSVTDACAGQSLSSSETVTVVSPDFTVADDQQCFNGNVFNFTNTGATGGTVSHLWDFGDGNSSSFENPSYSYASSGNYTVTHYVIYIAQGCTASADASIMVFDEPAILAIVDQNVSCVGGSDGALSTFVSGGTAPFNYTWLPNNETTASISNLTVGNYTVNVTDANGCTDMVTASIIQDDSELPNAICQNATVQLNASGSATISATVVDNGSTDNCGIASLVVSPNAFTCAQLGPNPVVLTVTDVNGNVSTCNATVTVQDQIPPVAVCQDVSVTLDASGNASITAAQVDNGSTDNCAIQSISLNQNTFSCADVPSTTVTLTVTDASGNTSTCNATVTVNDVADPVAVCQNISVDLDATGNVSVTGSQLGSGSTDNCGVVDITVAPADFTCADIGDNSVSVTVVDASGNSASCSAIVSVADNLAPNAICQNTTVSLDAAGNASISTVDVDGGSTDNCGIDNMTVSPNTFTCAEIGSNAVVLTVTDVNGLVSSCNATVTVEDDLGPTAVCQDITVALDANGMATIVAAQIDNGSTDNCSGSVTLAVTPNSFDCTVSAPAQVELTVTDVAGNSSTCSATVILVENTAPTAVCQDIVIQLDATGNASIVGADVDGGSFDNCGVADLSVDPSTFDCSNIGANTVTLTASDANGNSSTCTATVTVQENVPPVALCLDITVELDASGAISVTTGDVDAGSSDNCGIVNLAIDQNSFDCSNVGPNSVTLTATDLNGNSSSCVSTVTVADVTAPTALCQDVLVQLDASGNASVNASQVDNGSTDNCAIASVSLTPNTFDCSTIGVTQAVLTVTDVNGNSSTCTTTITVEDNMPPTAICQNITIQLDASGNASIVASDVDGGSSDNCGVPTLAADPTTFNCSSLGANNVTLTATDANGNSASCVAIVTVQDNIDPAAVCQDIVVQLDASGSISIVAADVDAGSTDNCAVTDLTVTPNTFDCSNLGTATVTLTAMDATGNSSTCSANVTVEDNVPPTAICQDINVQLDASGNATIVPSQIDNGSSDLCGIATISLDITSFDCSNLGQNTVELSVVDNSGNASTCSATVTILDNVDPNAICQNLTVYLDAAGSVAADPADVDNGSTDNCAINSLSLSQADFFCADLGQEIITLTVSDQSGNTDNCVAVITVLDTISPVIANCPADIQFTPDSSDCTPSVTWTEPTESDNCTVTMTSNFQSGDNFPVGTTTVTYDAEDQSGNTAACSFTITIQPSAVVVEVSSPTLACGYNISCNGADDGEATANVSGGCSPYQFQWSNGQTTETAVGLAAGSYNVVVTDANGTQVTETILLTEPEPLVTESITSPTVIGGTNISCAGLADGSINLGILGGADCLDYDFFWTGENGYTAIEKDISDVVAGTYVVTVTDANGCSHLDSITLSEPEPIDVQSFPTTYNGFNVSCFGLSNGLINVEVSAGTAPYSYQWNTGETTQDIDSLSAGTYDVIVTDTNGCQLAQSITLSEPTDLTVNPTDTTSVTCFGTQNGQFVVQATGGVPTYSYLWSNGDVDPILNAVGVGVYEVLVTDLNGCQDSLELEMTSPSAIDVSVLQVTDATCFGFDDGSATILASGGVGPYDYNWIAIGQNTQTASGLEAGDYLYEVTDANGCVSADTVQVSEPDQIILITSNDTTVCPGTVVSLSVEASGGGGTYLITWDNGQGFGNSYETYITQTHNIPVTAVDQNGCTSVPNSVVVTTFAPVVAAFTETIVDACTFPVVVDFANNSTNANSFSWSFGNGDSSTQFLPTAVYDTAQAYRISLVATSADGCVDSTHKWLTIDPLPEANFAIPNPDGCFPILVGLFNQSGPMSSILWDFGDGQTSDEPNPYHLYENPGSYDVTLIVTNENGCMDTLTVDSAVFAFPRPIANFTPVLLSFPEPGNQYTLINSSTGGNEYNWTFGNGDGSQLFEPTYTYPEFGPYDIVLHVYNEYGCVDTAQTSIYIELTYGLFVPNAMVIDNPGDAGVFLPKGEGIGEYHAWVYDKWGNMLWESTELFNGSPSEGWDGRYKGKLVPQGAYVWKINAIFKNGIYWDGMEQPNGKPKIVGSVTVLY
ncbi:MAG: choice-of-anchor L domain-containing protein [Flavobacteriales bacterium]|nr:choice-of-anchor L domain-containing protein [Flavobacteriales bacterium]